jgi:hypothetical protein
MSKTPQQVLSEAGQRAAQWYIDTDDCLFCAVDSAPEGQSHEKHCTFYGISDAALKEFLETLPELEIVDD